MENEKEVTGGGERIDWNDFETRISQSSNEGEFFEVLADMFDVTNGQDEYLKALEIYNSVKDRMFFPFTKDPSFTEKARLRFAKFGARVRAGLSKDAENKKSKDKKSKDKKSKDIENGCEEEEEKVPPEPEIKKGKIENEEGLKSFSGKYFYDWYEDKHVEISGTMSITKELNLRVVLNKNKITKSFFFDLVDTVMEDKASREELVDDLSIYSIEFKNPAYSTKQTIIEIKLLVFFKENSQSRVLKRIFDLELSPLSFALTRDKNSKYHYKNIDAINAMYSFLENNNQ